MAQELTTNFAVSTVATAPSPANSGTSLVVASGHGTRFPNPATQPFNAIVCPAAQQPTPDNAEIVRVTAKSTDTFTITRTQESTSARSIVVGDRIFAGVTAKTLSDLATDDLNLFNAIVARIQNSIVDGKGDMIAASANDTPVKLSAGSNGQVLVADSNATPGVKWATSLDQGWLPGGAKAQNMPKYNVTTNSTTLVSGTLRVCGGMTLRAGVALTSISMSSGNTALATGSNQWFCLIRRSDLSVLCKTADDTSTAWGASTLKTLSITGGYTPTADEEVYVGALVVASTMPNLAGILLQGGQIVTAGTGSAFCGTSTTGLTNPASLGATAASITGGGNPFWAYVS